MARRRSYRKRARRAYSKTGSFKPALDGMIAGAGGQIASQFVGSWGRPLAHLGVGIYFKNNTLKTLGGIGLGEMVGGMVGGVFGGSNGGGFYE